MFGVEYPRAFRDWVGNREILSSFDSNNGLLFIDNLKLEARAADLNNLENVLQARARDLGYQEAQTAERARQYKDVLREPEDKFRQVWR